MKLQLAYALLEKRMARCQNRYTMISATLDWTLDHQNLEQTGTDAV